MPQTLFLLKEELRVALRAQRNALLEAGENDHSRKLVEIFSAHFTFPEGSVVAGYCAKGSEIDPLPVMEALAAKGCVLSLPCVENKERALIFRLYDDKRPLVDGFRGIPEPDPDAPAVDPDILLVPLLGFDSKGQRLGQGGGYYDRTLKVLRMKKNIMAIGLAHSVQEMIEIPYGPADQKLDAVVTEKSAIIFIK